MGAEGAAPVARRPDNCGTGSPARHGLPHPYAMFPELVDTSEPEDDTPSCGLAEELARQELFVNQSVVTPTLAILWEFFSPRSADLAWRIRQSQNLQHACHPCACNHRHWREEMIDLTEFQQRAAAAATTKMLTGKHLSICDLDAIAATIGRKQALAGQDYAALRAVHCMDWADMGPDLAQMV